MTIDSKIKVRICFDVAGWAYFHRARILQEYAPSDMQITIAPISEKFRDFDADVMLDMNYGQIVQVRAELARRRDAAILVSSFNNGYPNRLDYLERAKEHAHAVVINNRECWEKTGAVAGTHHLSNGVDRRIFQCRTPMRERAAKAIWIGSDYHKKLKGYSDLLVPLSERLKGRVACDFRVIDPYTANGGAGSGAGGQAMTHAELVDWYNSASIYVVASLCEGTPNPALEAASCGGVLVTTRVGNMPELVIDRYNGVFVERTVDGLEQGVLAALERRQELSEAMQGTIAAWDWRARVEGYYSLFRQLLSGEAPLLRPRGTF